MRLASVTKSQLSCLRSALDTGGMCVQVWVFVLVVVTGRGWGWGGWKDWDSCFIKDLCNSQRESLFPTTSCFVFFCVFFFFFFPTNIPHCCWHCARLRRVSENRCVCRVLNFRERVKSPVINVITRRNYFLGKIFLTSRRWKTKHHRSQLDQCFFCQCCGT